MPHLHTNRRFLLFKQQTGSYKSAFLPVGQPAPVLPERPSDSERTVGRPLLFLPSECAPNVCALREPAPGAGILLVLCQTLTLRKKKKALQNLVLKTCF